MANLLRSVLLEITMLSAIAAFILDKCFPVCVSPLSLWKTMTVQVNSLNISEYIVLRNLIALFSFAILTITL